MSEFQFVDQKPDLLELTIEGERVRLVTISGTFAEDIFSEFTSDITRHMFPKPAEDIAETRAFIANSLQDMKAGDNVQLVILRRDDGEFLGCCGLHGRGDVTKPELGIWLKRGAHGHGYGREAVHALVKWARENISLEGFIYPVDKNNAPSRNIPVSLGGRVVGERVEYGQAGNRLDEVIYEIPASSQGFPSSA